MANHNVLLCYSCDCHVLNMVSLDDGKGSAVEYAHYEALDNIFQREDGAVALSFDDFGAHQLTGDGKLGPDLKDYINSQSSDGIFDENVWKRSEFSYEPVIDWYSLPNYDTNFVSVDRQFEPGYTYSSQVFDQAGNLIAGRWFPEELYGLNKRWVYDPVGNSWSLGTYDAQNWNGSLETQVTIYEGSYGIVAAFGDFAVHLAGVTDGLGGYRRCFVASKLVDGKYVPIHEPLYIDAFSNGNWDRSQNFGKSFVNGKFAVFTFDSGDYSSKIYCFSLSDAEFSFELRTNSMYYYYVIDTINKMVNTTAGVDQGLIKPTGIATVETPNWVGNEAQLKLSVKTLGFDNDGFPIISSGNVDFPVNMPEGWVVNGNVNVEWRTQPNGKWHGLLTDISTADALGNGFDGHYGHVQMFEVDFAQRTATPISAVIEFQKTQEWAAPECRARRYDFEGGCFVTLPAYKVDGYIKKDNQGIETDVILLDNDSQRVIGRTKSDPITGYYRFRCWSNDKKSVYAVHPVSKGLRIAAEVQPTPEA